MSQSRHRALATTQNLLASFLFPVETAPWQHRLAILLVIASSVGFSLGGLIVRSFDAATPWQVSFYRGLFIALVTWAIALIQPGRRQKPWLRSIGLPGLAAGVLIGLAPITFVLSLAHTTVANTLFVVSAIPFLTAALAWLFLRERVRRGTWIAMTVALLGISIMVLEGFAVGSLFGNLMALATAATFSGFAVLMRRFRNVDMLPTMVVAGLITSTVCFLVTRGELRISWHDIGLCFLWGGLIAGIGNWVFIVAIRHLAAAEITLLMLIEFVLGPVWVWLFINEIPSLFTVLGGSLVLAAVGVRAMADMRSRVPLAGV